MIPLGDEGRRARRAARATARAERGLPERRRPPGNRPSRQLRRDWPAASTHVPAPVGPPDPPRLMGAQHPTASVAPRARRPVVEREHPIATRPVTVRPVTINPVTAAPAAPPAVDPPPPAEFTSAGAEPGVNTRPAVVEAPAPVGAATGRRRRTLVLVAAVLLAGVGAGAGVLAARPDRPPVSAVDAPNVTSLVAWLRAALPADAVIVSDDPALARSLSASGIEVTTANAEADAPTDAFVVTAGPGDGSTTAVGTGRTRLPVARFGTGTGAAEVAQVVGSPLSAVNRDREAAGATSRAAGAGLLQNAAFTVAPTARAVFGGGGLDLRAAAFLALLATSQPVEVVSAPTDPAEDAVGLPVRRIVVSVADRSALQAAVAGSRAPYAPTVTTPDSAPGGIATGVLLTWTLSAAPPPVLT